MIQRPMNNFLKKLNKIYLIYFKSICPPGKKTLEKEFV